MTWKCPQCGIDGLSDELNTHAIENAGCGYARSASGVALASLATGKELRVRLPAVFGKDSLRMLGDPEVRFASSEQFRLNRIIESRTWCVQPVSWATNPTLLNAATIPPEGATLKNGDILSIRERFLRLSIQLIY